MTLKVLHHRSFQRLQGLKNNQFYKTNKKLTNLVTLQNELLKIARIAIMDIARTCRSLRKSYMGYIRVYKRSFAEGQKIILIP